MSQKRGYWFLLSGLGLGLAFGLLVAWVIVPTQFTDTTPTSLRTDFKDAYRLMIASAYKADADLPRARARLGTLSDANPLKALGEQAQRMLDSNISREEIQHLADLSTAMETQPTETVIPMKDEASNPPASMTPLPSPTQPTNTPAPPTSTITATASPSPTSSVTPTITASSTPRSPYTTLSPQPSQTNTATPGAPFQLAKQSNFCDANLPGLLQVNLTDKNGKPVAGVELVITWVDGEEHFFTGLKPELGYGYADYTMTKNVEYALSLAGGSPRITGLSTPKCSAGYPGGIRLEFKQP